jgi:hypothetical protein
LQHQPDAGLSILLRETGRKRVLRAVRLDSGRA